MLNAVALGSYGSEERIDESISKELGDVWKDVSGSETNVVVETELWMECSSKEYVLREDTTMLDWTEEGATDVKIDEGILEETTGEGNPEGDVAEDGGPKDGDLEEGNPEDGNPENIDPEAADPEEGDPEEGSLEDGSPEDASAEDSGAVEGNPEEGTPEEGIREEGTRERSPEKTVVKEAI